MDFKEELEAKAGKRTLPAKAKKTGGVRLTSNMTIVDMIHAMEPEIKKALPAVITPERFTRMAGTVLRC